MNHHFFYQGLQTRTKMNTRHLTQQIFNHLIVGLK